MSIVVSSTKLSKFKIEKENLVITTKIKKGNLVITTRS